MTAAPLLLEDLTREELLGLVRHRALVSNADMLYARWHIASEKSQLAREAASRAGEKCGALIDAAQTAPSAASRAKLMADYHRACAEREEADAKADRLRARAGRWWKRLEEALHDRD